MKVKIVKLRENGRRLPKDQITEAQAIEGVFENNSGEARSYTPTAFKNACNRAGIENVSFHTLRHTFATKMVQAGLPVADLQQILGHTNIAMTLRYSHLAPSQSSIKAVALLNKINQPQTLLT